jgi:hypothetical protein
MESSRLIPLSLWRLIATVCAGMLLVAVSGVWYTQRAISAEDTKVRQAIAAEGRIQCGIYTLLDTAYRQTPPATPAGRNFAAAIHKVVVDLGCGEK